MRKKIIFCIWFLWLNACSVEHPESSQQEMLHTLKCHHQELNKVWEAVEKDDIQQASREINMALQVSPRKPVYHLINGLIYERMSGQGQEEQQGMAKAAYQAAYNLDPSQWINAYLLGLSELEDRQYLEAQFHLTDALTLNPTNPNIMYALAYASYHLKDLVVARAMLKKALTRCPKNQRFLRGMVMISAACGEFAQAKVYLKKYACLKDTSKTTSDALRQRIEDWESSYQNTPKLTKIDGFVSVNSKPDGNELGAEQQQDQDEVDDITSIFFDCYSLQHDEMETAFSGQNIMNVLQIILSSSPLVTVSRTLDRATYGDDSPSTVQGGWTKTFSMGIAAGGLQYSLNLANARRVVTSVLSRPSIHTVLTKKATLLSGQNYTGGVNGSVGSSAASIDAGIGLEITPVSLSPEGVLTMHVRFSGSFFSDNPDLQKGFANQLVAVTRSRIETTVKAVIGQTVVIGGIYTKENSESENRTPVLGDIPIVQYFFGSKQTSSRVSSIIYLITARLGGSGQQLSALERKKLKKTREAVHARLKSRGLMSLGEFSNWYYIFGYLERSPLLVNFRSGDLEHPVSEIYEGTNLADRLHTLAKFLYF